MHLQENTNKTIAINSIILYTKMIITAVCGLLNTRFALQALGVVDYGLYAVLGGFISFIAIFNTIMLASSNRFISIAVGKGSVEEINKQFNVNLVIHISIALFALLVTYPLGEWYIPRFVNYDGPLQNAFVVFFVSIAGSIFSFVGVPYNGLLMAKEEFWVFSLIEVISSILRLLVAWALVYYFDNKLLIYSISIAIMTALPTVVYVVYCSIHYSQLVRLKIVKDKAMYKSIFSFSSWVAIGAVAQVGRDQGAGLVVNAFFNTIMNTALGVASTVNRYVVMFAGNVVQPMQPQITKSYAAGDIKRTDELLMMSTKYSFLLVLLIGSIFLIEPGYILGLWLGAVPPFATVFLVLLIIDRLVQSLNAGISNIIWASGNIKLYQIIVSTLNILSVVTGFFVLKKGAPAYFLIITYIIFSVIRFFAIQWALHRSINYDNNKLWRNSYIPSMLVTMLFLPVFLLPETINPLLRILITFFYLCLIEWRVGLSNNERERIVCFIQKKIRKR